MQKMSKLLFIKILTPTEVKLVLQKSLVKNIGIKSK